MRQLNITKQITTRETVSLNKYLQEISCEKPITAEEEASLAQQIKDGDEKAIDKLTKANLRFVVSVAKQYQHLGLSLNDLINEGNIGLIKAAKRFDATRGFKLISYAVWWIRQSIMQAIDEQSHIMRLPSQKKALVNKIRKASLKMEQEFHREPSYEEVGREINLSAEAINEIMNASRRQISIDAPLPGGEELTLMDLIPNKDGEISEQKQFNLSLQKDIDCIVATLPADEADVLRLYFGLNGLNPMTHEQIGEKYGTSGSRIRQLKEKALSRLRHAGRSKILKEYLG